MKFNPTEKPTNSVSASLGVSDAVYVPIAQKGRELYRACAGDKRTSERILAVRDAMIGHDTEECAILAVNMVQAFVDIMA